MRQLIFIVFMCWIPVCFAQSNGSTKDAEAEKSEDKNMPAEAEDERNDSIKVESKEERGRREAKGAKLKKASVQEQSPAGYGSYELDDQESQELEMNVQSTQYKTATYNFEYSKTNAANQRTQRSPSVAQQVQMDNAVEFFATNAPNSFEYNYFKYTAGNYNVDLVNFLKEAERLRPENTDVHVQMAAYNMITNQTSQAKVYLDKLISSNRLSRSALMYAEDILRSTPQGGTLITHGFDDSYGVWYMQQSKGVRKDVQLISLDFLQSDFYRKDLTAKGYKLPQRSSVDVNYLSGLCQLNAGKKIAVSMTTPKEYFKPVLNNMYAAGLVFEYRTNAYDNFPRNVELWENQLKKELVWSATDEKSKQLSSNYLPMLMQMRKVYNQQGNKRKVAELDRAIDKVGVQCRKYEQVQKLKGAY